MIKYCLHFARCVLHDKHTTCNTLAYKEWGQFPTRVFSGIKTPPILSIPLGDQFNAFIVLYVLCNID